ncbi:uncharacterized protein isoform X3 [Rhodnius prolixus]|uniref:uncharacterized protein isoform X3 n=1 Tax=Rhodnius prolixus TaxID=13249 RepID=UPI003D18CEAF
MDIKPVQQGPTQNLGETITSKEELVNKEKDEEQTSSDFTDAEFLVNGDLSSTNEEEPKLAKSFPWLTQFIKLCRAEIGVTNITTLENLMTVYLQHIGSAIVECYVKPNRAAKLKRCMNDTLVLFHMLYSDIKKPLEHSSYLDKMSDLLAYYIDMEIKASRRGKESLPKIASKLTSSLYLFLDHSIDHILDAILKTRNMTKHFCELCTYIFKRVLKEGPGRTVYEMTYVRYILVFKMWKRVVKGAEERRRVMKMAALKLIPPSQFREKLKSGLLCGVLPKIPKSRPDITMFLMQAKFCVKEKSKAFLKVVADPKQQCVLGPSLSADLDRPLFFGDGGDSPRTSNSDDQEDTSGSSILMNDIWSSMSLEAGLRDHLRLASVIVTKPKKSAKVKLKKKIKSGEAGIEGTVTTVDKVKKKSTKKSKKMINKHVEENKSVESKEALIPGKEAKPSVVTSSNEVSENCTQTAEDHGSKEYCESSPLIPIENIKVEADSSDDVCFVGILRKGDDDLVDGSSIVETRREKDPNMIEVAREVEVRSDSESSVKMERPGTAIASITPAPTSHPHDIFLYDQHPPTEWSPAPSQNYFNNAVCDFINGYLPEFNLEAANADSDYRDMYEMLDMGKTLQNRHREIFPINSDNVLSQLPLEDEIRNKGMDVSSSTIDNSIAAAGGNVTLSNDDHHTPSEQPETNQDKIDDELIESFKEQGRYAEKNSDQNVVSNNSTTPVTENETKPKEKGTLHDRTLRSDHSIFISQQQFRSLYITEVLPPSIPVPSPPKMDSSSRCDCDQCNANYEALQTNYKKLTAYKNSKINSASAFKRSQEDELLQGSEDIEAGKDSRKEPHSSLPLKKRKAIQATAPLKKEANETSYPCTPMMSIAVALETSKVGMQPSTTSFASKPLTTAVAAVDYTTTGTAQQFSFSSMVFSKDFYLRNQMKYLNLHHKKLWTRNVED